MLEFINGQVDFESYQKQINQILTEPNRDVLYQLAFDFFDQSNDDKISEFDLYKVFQYFSQSDEHTSLFQDILHYDITALLKIVEWKQKQQIIDEHKNPKMADVEVKKLLREKKEQSYDFRTVITQS